MPLLKCCVGGCDSTNNTHRLFCMPMNRNLRNLWLSLLVPTNPNLLGLTENQLLTKRVCVRHFDSTQFDQAGVRIRYSYPCLFTDMEIAHGVPLAKVCKVLDEHNYCQYQNQDQIDPTGGPITMTGNVFQEHQYSLPSTSSTTSRVPHQLQGDVSIDSIPQSTAFEQGESKNTTQMTAEKNTTRQCIKKCIKIAIDSLNQTNTECLQNAHKEAENHVLLKNFEYLDKKSKAFLLMQLKLVKKNKKAQRFSIEDKLFALTLMKQSPKGYKLLEKLFILPSKRTLSRLSNRIEFECGVNKNIFEHIKINIKDWDIKKRLCSLIFDEVALTPRLAYNESKDKIYGVVEIAGERKLKLADHALVFMVRGICSSWRQSIAYYFCDGTVSSPELLNILKEIIPLLVETGLKPLALVSDQGSTFRTCFKSLKNSTAQLRELQGVKHDDRILIAGHELYLFHDPPHLLKSIRNNFITKDILYQGKVASWKDILYIYDLDSKSGHTRAIPKLTAQHVDPKHINKMKVKVATQVLSARTAAMLNYTHALHEQLNMPKETMKATALVVEFFDDLFDSVNGSPGVSKGKLRCAVKPNSPHLQFWRQSLKTLKNIKYIDNSSKFAKNALKSRHVRVPCLDGWNTTLQGFLGLAKLLFSQFGVEYFYPRFINQDPLENFFGRIRAVNYRNVNPDVTTFIYAYKSLVLSNILSPHSKYSNCEEDNGDTLIDSNYLFISNESDRENFPINTYSHVMPSTSQIPQGVESDLKQHVIAEKVRVQTSAYTAGYICRKISKKIDCFRCLNTYTTKDIQGIHIYIKYREYKRLKNSNLAYPNEKMLRLYRDNSQIIHDYLNINCMKTDIKKNIKNIIIGKCDMSWLGCKKHHKIVINYYLTLVIRLQCHNWCNIINKILSGKIEEKYVSKMQNVQQLALKKCKTHRLRKTTQ
ncbi:unnamed protein product [Diatraea saccharalis]|uniref:THAP-type domain-containing protein n=1 Tax=Diatraea saccharalis TaxID=40085 RepID=A0A9N9WCI6_9NEOP|nr:unnamed protein product [Diatraea saccharalis]